MGTSIEAQSEVSSVPARFPSGQPSSQAYWSAQQCNVKNSRARCIIIPEMSYQQVGGDDLETAKSVTGLAFGAAKSYIIQHKDDAIAFASEKASALTKMVEDGDSSWRYLGAAAGCMIMFVSFTSFLSALFGFSLVLAVLDLYVFCTGALMVALEFKHSFIPSTFRERIRKEALFLYRPYGRAAFYAGVGMVLICIGGAITTLIGMYTTAVGGYIYMGSMGAMKSLSALRAQAHDEDTLRAKFQEADKDKSGYVDSQELAGVCAALGTTLKKNELESALFLLDKNEDGKITFEEFRSWWLDQD